MSPLVIVPVKSFDRGKSRLEGALGPARRRALCRELAERVLDAAVAVAPGRVRVVTDGDDVAAWALGRGVSVARDRGVGLREAVAGARGNEERWLAVMADLPGVEVGDLEAAVAALSGRAVVLAPDRAEQGTNLVGGGADAPLCLGRADSFEAHQRAAAALGLAVTVLRRPGLAWDVDVPADL